MIKGLLKLLLNTQTGRDFAYVYCGWADEIKLAHLQIKLLITERDALQTKLDVIKAKRKNAGRKKKAQQ